MTDREKIILKRFDKAQREVWNDDDDFDIGFNRGLEEGKNIAISLLKKQKAKKVEAEVINEIDRLYRCPSCHISMMLRGQPYCHNCGQAVKWE